ncbi:MAG: YfhO family protein [Clostridia bacterium]|nr:YfhO family protein [Clostridia bacterium]
MKNDCINFNQYKSKLRVRTLCIGACMGSVIGLMAFLPILVRHNGQLMDFGDYFLQYVPFIKEFKRMVLSGDLSWSWNSFLGDSFIGAYSYYTVFNPFAWIVALFPDDYILYGTMFATTLKLSVCVVTAMLFVRRFCNSDIYALIGGLLYAFSGFTLVNTNFYFFLDVVAVFPLVLYGLEILIEERKNYIYVFSLLLNAAINFYFFVSTVLLVVIYVVFRLNLYKISLWKNNWIILKRIILYSIIGTGLAGFSLIPSFYAILGSGKATASIGNSNQLMYFTQEILERIRTLVAPIESSRYRAFFDSGIWSSTGVYLPVFGFVCVLQWLINKKDWLKKTCIFLLICYFVPFLNAAFNLFSSTAYTRWLYGMALIFSLITALSLEEISATKDSINKKLLAGITSFTFLLLLVPTVTYFLYKNGIYAVNRFASVCVTWYFMGYSPIIIMLILTAFNYIAVWCVAAFKKPQGKMILIIVSVACLFNFGIYNEINYGLHNRGYTNSYYLEKSLTEGVEKEENFFEYRIDYPEQIANYSLFKNRPSVNYYNSLQNPGSSRFAYSAGIGDSLADTVLINPVEGAEYTDALLSVKYYYDYDGEGVVPKGFSYLRTENEVKVYENDNYIPMGFVYDTYCTEMKLKDMLPKERAKAMLQTLVVKDSDVKTVSKYLKEATDFNDDFDSTVSSRKKSTSNSFVGTSSGFSADIYLDEENIVFFSIPYDTGWEITVNGVPANILEVNYGLLGICCNAGANEISATYHTQGLNLGIICSLACLFIWLFAEVLNAFSKRKKKHLVSIFRNSVSKK